MRDEEKNILSTSTRLTNIAWAIFSIMFVVVAVLFLIALGLKSIIWIITGVGIIFGWLGASGFGGAMKG